MPAKNTIQSMFNNLAPIYDLLNNILSLGTHWLWKKKLCRKVLSYQPTNVLDGATGTGDVALLLKSQGITAVGVDISQKMLQLAREKDTSIEFKLDDLTDLSFANNSFDVSTVSFGVRNVSDLNKCLDELIRVSRKGVVILEFGSPRNKILRFFYFSLMKLYIPLIGLFFGKQNSYRYLIESSSNFVSDDSFIAIVKNNQKVLKANYEPVFFGIAYLYSIDLNENINLNSDI